ncbi:MAG: hypothetical protein ACI9HG_000813, partial [Flavobacteriales bacterium]
MTNSRKTLFLGLLFICTLVLSNSVVAQDTVDEARVMFVEIEDLDPYSYKDIVEGLESSKGFA